MRAVSHLALQSFAMSFADILPDTIFTTWIIYSIGDSDRAVRSAEHSANSGLAQVVYLRKMKYCL